MSLIVEDGSGVPGANSYNSIPEIKAYAKARNVDLSSVEGSVLQGYAIDAMDWIESFRDRFKGVKTSTTQSLQFPRQTDPLSTIYLISPYIKIDGIDVLPNQIPRELKSLQCQLVIERSKGTVLFPTGAPDSRVKLQKVGPITTEYQLEGTRPNMPAAEALLSVLLENSGVALAVIRV